MSIGTTANILIKNINFKEIIKPILGLFLKPDEPVPPIDPMTILTGVPKNPGLSPRKTASIIIARQTEAGAPFGALPSGADNVAEKMEIIRVQEIFKALQQEARITVVTPPGILVQGTAISPVGPLPVVGTTSSPAHIGFAAIQ